MNKVALMLIETTELYMILKTHNKLQYYDFLCSYYEIYSSEYSEE